MCVLPAEAYHDVGGWKVWVDVRVSRGRYTILRDREGRQHFSFNSPVLPTWFLLRQMDPYIGVGLVLLQECFIHRNDFHIYLKFMSYV